MRFNVFNLKGYPVNAKRFNTLDQKEGGISFQRFNGLNHAWRLAWMEGRGNREARFEAVGGLVKADSIRWRICIRRFNSGRIGTLSASNKLHKNRPRKLYENNETMQVTQKFND